MASFDLGSWRGRHPQTFGQELIFLGVIWAGVTALFMLVVHPLLGWTTFAPIPLRSVILALAIMWIAKESGQSLATFGLARPRRIWLAILMGFVLVAIVLFALQPLKDLLREAVNAPPADYSMFEHIHGNLPIALMWLVVAWVPAAFCEEFIFRGYLLNRIAALSGGTVLAWGLAIFAQAALFGLMHLYQGWGSVPTVGLGALFSGVFFLLVGRNLWPLIIAHGVWDTAAVALLYLHGTPS